MNRKTLLITLIFLLAGVCAEAQRPVGDTVILGCNSDYRYDTMYLNPYGIAGYFPTLTITHGVDWVLTDAFWCDCRNSIMLSLLQQMDGRTYMQQYPDVYSYDGAIHITGKEFAVTEDLTVVGLAVCPTIITNPFQMAPVSILDTSMANRLTEYVQLYTLEDGEPQLRAQGSWRWEDPHRYMLFPYTHNETTNGIQPGVTTCVPLFETMFDTSVLIEADKTQSYILAGTHNNNGVMWADTCWDSICLAGRFLVEHYPTAYSSYLCDSDYFFQGLPFWVKYGSFPWITYTYSNISNQLDINIFPILDTLFNTPCAVVTGLQTVEVDSLWATLMWSADARQHEWEVAYRPADDSLASDMVVTVTVPTVTLMGLTPGTAYSVRVRGLCDVEDYSPWSDTLQFVTTFTPPDTTPDTLPWIHPWIHPHTLGIGNLDRFTRMMPNPAHDVVSVFSSYQLEGVTVYDLTGRQLIEQPAEGMTATVNVAALPRGTYILAIRTLQGTATKKLLVK